MKDDDRNKPDSTLEKSRRRFLIGAGVVGLGLGLPGLDRMGMAEAAERKAFDHSLKRQIKNVVVIYAENRSFNNLFGNFPGVSKPLSAVNAKHFQQKDRNGQPLPHLPKIWGGLVPTAQTIDGQQYLITEDQISGLSNAPFPLKDTQGKPLNPGLITRDLVHAFYQNQMQINGGRNDGFVAWGDSGALVMGYYSQPEKLRLWKLAQEFTLCDNFFMAAFGGSFLNHQFLISGRAPFYPNHTTSPAKDKVAVLKGKNPLGYELALADNSPASALDGRPVFVNPGALSPDGYAINTMLPPYQPSQIPPPAGGDPALSDPTNPSVLPPQTHATIGDLLSAKGVDWAWYSGGWQAALEGNGADTRFQAHHQPFNYFKRFAPGTAAREQHIRDGGIGDDPSTNRFLADIDAGRLPPVTFYKPQGSLNLHAGYADVASGDQHIAKVIEHLQKGPQWENTVVVITFDENGGWWDHVAPPKGDRWGPGTRIPALVVSPFARKGHVDHDLYDTTSILRLITRLHGLPPLKGLVERDIARVTHGLAPLGDLTGALTIR
ncbi:acid phosphatase [Pseudomonas sp.]|uniref:acid phosphatase n=1 Tax=Pseudomonas sp. TaxID=306 RepID=UPI0028AE4856|nr:acid phosphatase [Pseudomonas sp.]